MLKVALAVILCGLISFLCCFIIYAIAVSILLSSSRLQRIFLYLHNFDLPWAKGNLCNPEYFGFLPGQVVPFRLPTPDGEQLFAWLVIPPELWHANNRSLADEAQGTRSQEQLQETLALKLLHGHPRARLVIYFHGNAASLAASWRPAAMRVFQTCSSTSDPIFVLTIDYRGFGLSSGQPNEPGLVLDAVTAIEWAQNAAGISTERIALVGNSLGTAIAVGALAKLLEDENSTRFAGVMLIACFASVEAVAKDYKFGGIIPLFGPLMRVPVLGGMVKRALRSSIQDTWKTDERIANISAAKAPDSATCNPPQRPHYLTILHAQDDPVIPCEHGDTVFAAAVGSYGNVTDEDISRSPNSDQLSAERDMPQTGQEHNSDFRIRERYIVRSPRDTPYLVARHVTIEHGGHDELTTFPIIALELGRMFGIIE